MKRNIFLATSNEGKIQRFNHLLEAAGVDVKLYTPKSCKLGNVHIKENGETLAENAEIKARAYFGKVDMPIIATDTGFFIEGEGLIDAPKRMALGGADENKLTRKQIAEKLLEFWKGVARKHGGNVDAAWIEVFIRIDPNGTVRKSESRREVILTDHAFGKAHIQMPVRALYISKTTSKPALHQTREEELIELKPVLDALKILIDPLANVTILT